jgi:hypothetical protein
MRIRRIVQRNGEGLGADVFDLHGETSRMPSPRANAAARKLDVPGCTSCWVERHVAFPSELLPEIVAVFRGVYDSVLLEVCDKLNGRNQTRVQEAVATSIIEMAKTGELDPQRLKAKGLRQTLVALGG